MANSWRWSSFWLGIYFSKLPNHKICQVNFGKLLEMLAMLLKVYEVIAADNSRRFGCWLVMNGCVSFHLQNCCEIIAFQNLLGWYLEIGSLEMTLVETVRSESETWNHRYFSWTVLWNYFHNWAQEVVSLVEAIFFKKKRLIIKWEPPFASLTLLGDAWQIKQIKSKKGYPIMIPKWPISICTGIWNRHSA